VKVDSAVQCHQLLLLRWRPSVVSLQRGYLVEGGVLDDSQALGT
jgi:hypothetical protein